MHVVAVPAPLVISIESTERLRQMLRTESLTSEGQLVAVVKDALAMQFLRGVNEGVVQAGKDPSRLPSRSAPKPGAPVDSWILYRRAQRNRKIRNVVATVVIMLLAVGAIATMTAFRPPLSGDSARVVETIRY